MENFNTPGSSWAAAGHGLMLPPAARPKPKADAPAGNAAPSAPAPVLSQLPAPIPVLPPETSPHPPSLGPSVELKYKEPLWSPKQITHPYKLEVLKNGVLVETIAIHGKGFYLVGRLPICDLELEHPSISRQHAVIQHRNNGCVYLFDLGSTHGSFINKVRVKPKLYIELKDGDLIRFGESTRLFVLTGGPPPPEPAAAQSPAPRPSKQSEAETDKEGGDSGGGEGGDDTSVFQGNIEEFKSFMMQKGARGKLRAALPDIAKAIGGRDDDDQNEAAPKSMAEGEDEVEDEENPEDLEITKHATAAEEDYDSGDENDEFFDRTAKSRSAVRPGTKSHVQTTDTLLARNAELEKQKEDLMFALHQVKARMPTGPDAVDSLDSFMGSVHSSLSTEKEKRIEAQLQQLETEQKQIQKLIQISLPALDRIKSSFPLLFAYVPRTLPAQPPVVTAVAHTIESTESSHLNAEASLASSPAPVAPGPRTPAGLADFLAEMRKREREEAEEEARAEEAKKLALESDTSSTKKRKFVTDEEAEEEETNWAPPIDQDGSGRTRLNDVLGY